MEVIPKLTPTVHRALKRGQLAYVHAREGLSLVLALSEPGSGEKAFCFLPFDAGHPPRIWEDHLAGRTEPMLLVDSDWIVEAWPSEHSQPDSSPLRRTPGALVITETGPFLVTAEDQYGDALAVNLKTVEVDTLPRRGWPTLDWKIWASEKDRGSPNGRPLFTCKVKPTKA